MKTLKLGQKVQIIFKKENAENMQIICTIAKIEPDRLVLNYPDKLMRFSKYLSEGTEIQAFVYTDLNIQVLDSIVINAPYEEEFAIEYPHDHVVIQRRAYIREDLVYNIILQDDKKTVNAVTKDMGGGGCRFITGDPIEPGSYMKMWINFNDNTPSISCHGKVSQKFYFKPNEYLIEFTEITEKDRNKIIQECIKHQVKTIKK